MPLWNRTIDFSFRGWLVLSVFTGALVLAWTVIFALRVSHAPLRCRSGFVELEARCCAPGQGISGGECVGTPSLCPAPYQTTPDGCVLPPTRILLAGGSVTLGPTDWDSAESVERIALSVRSFFIDQSEVDHHRYETCVKAGVCTTSLLKHEPGTPQTEVTADQAQTFCRFAGGRLPTVAEWIFSASGTKTRRFPWGPHGLVCRRAVFGLNSGPCATQGTSAELPGMRPDGQSPDGVLDLSGNVAEWALDPQGQPSVRGGSFRSKSAGELKTWAAGRPRVGDDVGFRCVYETSAQAGP